MKPVRNALLLVGLLFVAFAALGDRAAELLPIDLPTPLSTSESSLGLRPVLVAAPDDDVRAAIQDVIQRSNAAQAQAIAARDPAGMAATVTAEHLADLARTNQELLDSGVTAIAPASVDWGPIVVDGATARATTSETWRITLADGTTRQARDRNEYTLVLVDGAWRIQTNDHPGEDLAPAPRAGQPASQGTSQNWSGYAAAGGGRYTGVSGSWTVPSFNPSNTSFGIDAAWVGIGGVRSRDLIQAGTQQTASGSGSTHYEAWVEMLPHASRTVPLRIHPGDAVAVSISEQSPDDWLIAFTNQTTGQTYQETQTYASSHSSAEWVQEAPSSGRGGILPLSNFGSIAFSAGSTIRDGASLSIADAGARAITMVGRNLQPLAVPSPLGSDGASFTVERTGEPAATATEQRGPRVRRGGN
jgi:hypothetical protein